MDKTKINRLVGLVLCVLLLLSTDAAAVTAKKSFDVGIVLDGPQERFAKIIDVFQQEMHRVLDAEFRVNFNDSHIRSGGWSVPTINREIDSLLKNPDVDIILALGVVASNEICKRQNLVKPVIATLVVDINAQGLPRKKGSSGVKNLFYVNSFQSVDQSVGVFSDITPFNSLAIMLDRFSLESIPSLRKFAREKAARYDLKVTFVEVGPSIEDALAALPADVDAVMVTLLEQITPEEFQLLTNELIRRKLPSYSYNIPYAVKMGILGSVTPQSALQSLARHVAINVQEIMDGEDAGRLPVGFNLGEKLIINMKTARAIGVFPSWKIRTEAELINDESEGKVPALTIQDAVNNALDANLDLLAEERKISAGEQQVNESLSGLLPQIEIGASGRVIDDDRAQTSQNTAPERLIAGSASATQVIYSDKAWSGYTSQKYLQAGRMEDRDSLRLDVMQTAATSYLNVLRAKAIERIQKENLKLTRKNLERARIRQSIGAAGPDEVYRWESQIANSRQSVLLSESVTLDAMTALNRIMNRPLTERFEPLEAKPGDPMGILEKKRLTSIMENPVKMGMFRDFAVQEGLENSPELRSLKAGISARERISTSSQREFWLPTFSLRGNVSEAFSKEGEGSDDIPGRDDTDWDIGVYASLPLFSGGRDLATYRRTKEEVKQLQIRYKAASQQVEERILNSMNLIRVSYPGIELSQDALEAANKNLELVTDAYSRGLKSIIELLDAQNQVLVAGQTATNAIYDFMIDMMAMQRSIGEFILFADEDTRGSFFQRMETFIENQNQEKQSQD